jgi:hypothetical protein
MQESDKMDGFNLDFDSGDKIYYQHSLRNFNKGKSLGNQRARGIYGSICKFDSSIEKIMNIPLGVGVYSQRIYDSSILPTIYGLHSWHRFASIDQFLENFLPQFNEVRLITDKDFGMESLLDTNILFFLKSLMNKGVNQVKIMEHIVIAKHSCSTKISAVIVNHYPGIFETLTSDEPVMESSTKDVFVHTFSNEDSQDNFEFHLYLFLSSLEDKFSLEVDLIIPCFIPRMIVICWVGIDIVRNSTNTKRVI